MVRLLALAAPAFAHVSDSGGLTIGGQGIIKER